jgi:lysophospholipid acyltransferase (LPLAT)-like uncharacterized protein
MEKEKSGQCLLFPVVCQGTEVIVKEMTMTRIWERISARIIWAIILLWSKTIRFRMLNNEVREQFIARGENCIYAFWHGSLLMLIQSHHDSGFLVPVSESRDGEFIARVAKNFGFDVASGSSKRKGSRALLTLISRMRTGKNVGITVDGPRGPLHKVKEGALFLSGVSKAPIIPVATAAKHSWIIEKSWDHLEVPVPFTKGLIMLGEPMYMNGTSEEEIASGQRKLEAELHALTKLAQAHVQVL